MAVGWFYRLGRALGNACICGIFISTGAVLSPCVFSASFLGTCKGEADPDGWIFDPFIGAGTWGGSGGMAEPVSCVFSGFTPSVLGHCPNKNTNQNLQHMGAEKVRAPYVVFLC